MADVEKSNPSLNTEMRAQNLTGTQWDNRTFENHDFRQVQANQSQLRQVQFRKCLFHAMVVREAAWTHCQFSECVGRFVEVEHSNYQNSQFTSCQFEESHFYETDFANSTWRDSNLTASDLRYSSFKNAILENVNLNNCDLAHVDFTGCTLSNVTTYNARITHAKGLSEQQRDQLLAGGAYEGLPPTFNKLRKRGVQWQRSSVEKWQQLRQKIQPTTWINTEAIYERVKETYTEWQEERKRQQEQLARQETEWQQSQQERRTRTIEERRLREERRQQEKEVQQEQRQRLAERRKQEQQIQTQLQAQQKERQALHSEIVDFFDTLQGSDHFPDHILELGNIASSLYQDTEQALEEEERLRQRLQQDPLNAELQQTLHIQGEQTQALAQEAMDAQQRYFQQVQNWKREEAMILERLQSDALRQSTQLLFENQDTLLRDPNAGLNALLQTQLSNLEKRSQQELLRAQLEMEQAQLQAELDAARQNFAEEYSTPPSTLLQRFETTLPNKPSSLEWKDTPSIPPTTPFKTEEFVSLQEKIIQWFTPQSIDEIEGESEYEFETKGTVDSVESFPREPLQESQEQQILQASDNAVEYLRLQLQAEMDTIEQKRPSELDPQTIQDLRRIQEALLDSVIQVQLEKEWMSPEELTLVQSEIIAHSLLSFQQELESEEAELHHKKAKEEAERIQEGIRLAELERLETERVQRKEQERLARIRLEAEREAILDAKHKAELRKIIDSKYEALRSNSLEAELKGLPNLTGETLQSEGSKLQLVQSEVIHQTLQHIIDTTLAQEEAERLKKIEAETREAQKREEQAQKQRQAQQKREEYERREAHRRELRKQAEAARALALTKAQERREQEEALRQAELAQKEEQRKQMALEKEQQAQERLARKQAEAVEQARIATELAEQRERERLQQQLDREEKERQLALDRKRERLALLKSQLFEEARKQEYEELSAQIEAEMAEEQDKEKERQRKQAAFLQQIREEQLRRENDPLLLEQQRQQELLARKQERLQRLQAREREIQQALLQIQAEYEQDNLTLDPQDMSFQMQSPWQQRWYRLTDSISDQSPTLAKQLDTLKEYVEEVYLARQAQARFSREQQKQLAATAIEAKRRQEHQERLVRLADIRAREERREAKLLDDAQRRAQQELELEQRRHRLALSHEERHQLHRTESLETQRQTLDHSQQDLRGQDFTAVTWIGASLGRSILSGIRLEAANLIRADISLGFLDYANLKGATLDEANLDKCTLEGAQLQFASLQKTHLRLTRMYDADLKEIDARYAVFQQADLTGSRAPQANFAHATLDQSQLVEMNLRGATFANASLKGCLFGRSDLEGANFENTTIEGCDFRGARGLTLAQLEQFAEKGALVDLSDAIDRYGSWGAPQLRAAIVLFSLGLGSLFLTNYLDQKNADLEAMEQEAQSLRDKDFGLASEKYEQLAENSQVLDEQVQYFIEAATLAEQNADVSRSEELFQRSIQAADLNTELNAKVRLRFAQFLLAHSKPTEALAQLNVLMSYQSLSTFQRAKLIFYTEQSCEIVACDAAERLVKFYETISSLPDVQADLHMALSDLRLQHGQSDAALAELEKATDLVISDGLKLRLLESKARANDRLGNISEAIAVYETLTTLVEPNSPALHTTELALADLWRRNGDATKSMAILTTLIDATENDGRLRSRSLLIQGRLLEEQGELSEAANRYKDVLVIQDVEPETMEESRVSLARLILQSNPNELGEIPEDILTQAKLGEARTLLDKGEFEEALEQYRSITQSNKSTLSENIRRAAESGMAEALSNLGKHMEANDMWEGLLREKLDPIESQHIEVLLAYSKLQANDIAGARAAFASLQQSNDASIRYQGWMGSAQASVLAGELESAKEAYERILQSTPSEEVQIQVWQELAQIAQSQNSIEDVLLAWRNILQFSVDDDALRSEAHTSIATALAKMERLDEALAECELNLSTAEAQFQCASIMEMAGDERAYQRYDTLMRNERVQDALRSEAALGAARLGTPPQIKEASLLGLSLSQIDPIVELQLIQRYIHLPNIPEAERSEWLARQQQLGQSSPQVLITYLMEYTSQLRSDGALSEAITVMEEGIQGLTESDSLPLLLELADMLHESKAYDKAAARYQYLLEQNPDSSVDPVLIRSGLARTQMALEQWDAAIDTLSVLSVEDITSTEIQMVMTINQQAPSAKGLQLASEWATRSTNPDVQWEALMTQAQSAFDTDNYAEATQLYREAKSIAVEPRQQEWADLGLAHVFVNSQDFASAIATLTDLLQSEDGEIQIQAQVQLAQTHLSQEDPQAALETLKGVSARELGPGWDMTLEEVRATAYAALTDYANAYAVLTEIEQRWPDEEQVQIPSQILKIQFLEQEGDTPAATAQAESSLELAEDPVYRSQITDILTRLR